MGQNEQEYLEQPEEHWSNGREDFANDQADPRPEPVRAPGSLLPSLLNLLEQHHAYLTTQTSYAELQASLKSELWHVRAAAVKALALPERRAPLELFAAALHDEHPLVRMAALRAWGNVEKFAPPDPLISALLHDSAWQVREMAALVLGELEERGQRVPTAPLLQALNDRDVTVRRAAAQALRQVQPDKGAEERATEHLTEWRDREQKYQPERRHISRRRLLVGLSAGVTGAAALGTVASYYLIFSKSAPARNSLVSGKPPSPYSSAKSDPYNQWTKQNGIMFGFDAQHSGFNALENTLNATNVSYLTPAWTSDLPGEDILSSPVLSGELAYVATSSGRLYALEAPTGQIRWSSGTPHASSSSTVLTPAVFNNLVYISSQDRRLSALDALSGKVRWTSSAAQTLYSSPIIANGLVLVTDADRVSAFDAATGQSRWVSPLPTNSASPVAVADGVVYVNIEGNGANHGRIYALDAETGAVRWISDLSNGGTDTNSSPTVEYGLVYVGSAAGGVMALDAANGHLLWLSPATTGSTGSSPAVAYGNVYFVNDRVYAFDAKSGHQYWVSRSLGAYNDDSPLVANGILYVCSAGNNSVYALDARTGKVLWDSTSMQRQLSTTPAVVNGVVYITSENGEIRAFHLPG